MNPRADWMERIPHAGAMRLLDVVHRWSETHIHAMGERHPSHQHPLRSDAGLHAVHLAEYGAQAVAVHAALIAASRGDTRTRQGRLVSLRDVQLMAEYIDLAVAPLDVHAQCLVADERGAQYSFRVEQRAQLLAAGRVAIMHVDA
ncbi:MAG TPA: phosphotransferase [Dyella sp.]|uniref:phosphotransferase n=1 Tax=Dyella sp. TaxID=1869338 RepID=UPI002BE77132|nr:phosphotransferase [Dyella sp.]HTV86229.1 phosphotransferase [Dyella sp.]